MPHSPNFLTLVWTLCLVFWYTPAFGLPFTCTGTCGTGIDPVVGDYYWVSTEGGVEGVGLNLFGNDTTGSVLQLTNIVHPQRLWLKFETDDDPDFDYFWVTFRRSRAFSWLSYYPESGVWTGPFQFDINIGPGPLSIALGVVNTLDTLFQSSVSLAIQNDVPAAAPTPEPSTILLMGVGAMSYWRYRRFIGGRAPQA